ncbi:hypothetical protein UlMin_035738 [Ulmus minor]
MGRNPCSTKEGMNKGVWTAYEDKLLIQYVTVHGERKWSHIHRQTGLKRSGKSCRLRWLNYLKPGIKRGNISQDEEELIIRLHKLLGNRWSLIAGRLPGRTDNEIKNYWHTILSKKAQAMNDNKAAAFDETLTPIRDIKRPRVEASKPINGTKLPSMFVGNYSNINKEENSLELMEEFNPGDMNLQDLLSTDFDLGISDPPTDSVEAASWESTYEGDPMKETWSCDWGYFDSDFDSLSAFLDCTSENWILM